MSSEDNSNKHSKMTLMNFQEAMEWVNSPQSEPRIGSLEALESMLKGLRRENKDNKPGDGGKQSPFMIRLGGS
jgi:hypothetical protein